MTNISFISKDNDMNKSSFKQDVLVLRQCQGGCCIKKIMLSKNSKNRKPPKDEKKFEIGLIYPSLSSSEIEIELFMSSPIAASRSDRGNLQRVRWRLRLFSSITANIASGDLQRPSEMKIHIAVRVWLLW
ncbi:unnamed protein product [Arabidopsis arenosa]|uniref:Uncharacterized protein n=1 Tax=Arabidopsis arenosa TaxID=38785 RepID=A0A8S1ZS57_ARAAE|nr:unnamed protein product [Arabidopsis arenosa]